MNMNIMEVEKQKLAELCATEVIPSQRESEYQTSLKENSYLTVWHEDLGEQSEEGFLGWYDFSGNVTKTLPDHLKVKDLWYHYDEENFDQLADYFNEFKQ